MEDDEWAWRFGRRGVGNGSGPMGGMGMGGFNGDFGPSGGFGSSGYGNSSFGGNGFSSGPPGPHIVQMRGLPFRATKQDIADFFRPVIPLSIDLNASDKGFAEVEFRSYEDARLAMSKVTFFTLLAHSYFSIGILVGIPGSQIGCDQIRFYMLPIS